MQETKTITLPVSKKQVVLKGYMTGRIEQEIKKVMLSGFKFEGSADNLGEEMQAAANNISTDLSVQVDADNKKLELMVVSVAGATDDLLNKVLDLPSQDTQYIIDQITEIEQESKVASSDPKAPTS